MEQDSTATHQEGNPTSQPQAAAPDTQTNPLVEPVSRSRTILFGGAIVALLVIAGGAYAATKFATPKAEKIYHVGILSGLDYFLPEADGFKQKMTELGYVEGKNIVYDLQKTNFETAKEQQILQKFVSDGSDLIFTFPTEVSLAAKEATKGTTIPVVFAAAYTEGVDLIDSVARPGGNLTGVRYPGSDISIKRLQYLHELLPEAKRIWVTYQKDYPPVPPLVEKVRAAAERMGLTLVEVPALGLGDIQADFDMRNTQRDIGVDAMLGLSEPLAIQPIPFAAIVKFAAEHELVIGDTIMFPDDTGPLFSVVTESTEMGAQAAVLADKIFRGAQPGSIPVSSPETYLTINAKVAQKMGVTLSEEFLAQAKKIIH